MDLYAGTHAVSLPLAPGGAMMGYGARRGGAEGVHDPLHARALYLRGHEGEALLVSTEVCLLAPSQCDGLRARIGERTGLDPGHILIGCIHTHSGPETGLLDHLGGKPESPEVTALLDAVVEAACGAVAGAAPARLGVGRSEARIGRNRRRADAAIDPAVHVVRVDDPTGAPKAILYVHGCHPTALGHDNRAYSADWPWAAGERIRRGFPGAMPLFLLGAHGDVDPRTRGLLDLAIAGQSLGVGFDEVERLGAEVGDAVVLAASTIETTPDAEIDVVSARLRLATHREDEGERAAALGALDLSLDERPSTRDWFRLEHERTDHLPRDEKRERVARVRQYLRGRLAPTFAGSEEPEVEVQVVRIGPLRLLALPAEATVDVGLAWAERMGACAAVVSIANGWLRYLPHPAHFDEPDAHHKYEILMSTFQPDAAKRLLDAAEAIASGLGEAGDGGEAER